MTPYFSVSKKLNWLDRSKAVLVLLLINTLVMVPFLLFNFEDVFSGASERDNFLYGLVLIITIPFTLFEEFIFRYIPYKLSAKLKHKYFWSIGIISSLVFALLHYYAVDFQISNISLPQLISGIYLWRYIPSGFANVALIHIIYNLVISLVLLIPHS